MMATFVMCKLSVPVLFSTPLCAALEVLISVLANAGKVAGTSATTGAMPVPLSETGAGLAMPVTVMLMLALRAPVAPGSKVMLSMQFEFGAICPPPAATGHVVAESNAKSAKLVPVMEMPEMFSGAPPVLAMVRDCAALVVATRCVLKLTEFVERVSVGGVTEVPVRAMVCVEPVTAPVSSIIIRWPVGSPLPSARTGRRSCTMLPLQVRIPRIASRAIFRRLVATNLYCVGLAPPRRTLATFSVSVPELLMFTSPLVALVVSTI